MKLVKSWEAHKIWHETKRKCRPAFSDKTPRLHLPFQDFPSWDRTYFKDQFELEPPPQIVHTFEAEFGCDDDGVVSFTIPKPITKYDLTSYTWTVTLTRQPSENDPL